MNADKAAQEARSHKYHIAIKEGGNVTKPKEFEGVSDDKFGDPVNYRYPMADKAHADNAAARWGDASNREQYSEAEQKIIGDRIAARQRHFGEKPEEKGQRMDKPVIVRADGSHEPFTGTHSHAHSAMGEQGGDETHEHEHSHDGDANHEHNHKEQKADAPDILRTLPSELQLYMPILRVDKANREIYARATSEALDGYKTIFDFDASKQAFGAWRGNIREMHDPHKAVGKAIKWEPVENERAIDVILRVSKGAEDTWQKVLDGTLSGLSVGAKNGKWEKRNINGEEVPVLVRYDLVEVSLVDNPANPDCNIAIVRADGLATDVVDATPDDETPESVVTPSDTRAGKAISAANADKIHQSMLHSLQAAKSAADMCGCDDCKAVSMALDSDCDGDIDIVPSLDTDNDGGSASGNGSGDGMVDGGYIMNALQPAIERIVKETVEKMLQPTVQRYSAIASRFAQIDTNTQHENPELTRRLESVEGKLTGLDEVRSLLSEVKGLAEKIAAQPTSGGPVLNSTALNRERTQMSNEEAIERVRRLGLLTGKDDQISAALAIHKAEYGIK